MLAAIYNTFSNAHFAAFGTPESIGIKVSDWSIEFLFGIDLILNFFTEVVDKETNKVVSECHRISKIYLKSQFTFDLLACLPLEYILDFGPLTRLLRLVKLLRLPRLVSLIRVYSFKQTLARIYQQQLSGKCSGHTTKIDTHKDQESEHSAESG